EGIRAHKMRTVGKQRDRMQQFCNLRPGIAVAKDGQSKGGLGDEYVALDQFEGCAGWIRDILVVAGGNHAQTVCLDGDLRRTKYVAGGVEGHPCAPAPDGLAITDC